MNHRLLVVIALVVLLLVGCSESGLEGAWVTASSSRFGTWLQINGDGTFSSEGASGVMDVVDGVDCLPSQNGQHCHPVTLDGDILTVNHFASTLNFWPVDQEAHEQPQSDHPLVGPWTGIDTGVTIDFLPNGQISSPLYSPATSSFWTADDNIVCELVFFDLGLQSKPSDFPIMWKEGECVPIVFDDPYVTLREGTRFEWTLRRNE